jgi:hypothetical protein
MPRRQPFVPGVDEDREDGSPSQRGEEGLEDAQEKVAEQEQDAVEEQRRDALTLPGQRRSQQILPADDTASAARQSPGDVIIYLRLAAPR